MSDDSQTHIDVATGGVGVRADLVGRIDQCLCIGLFKTRQADVQVDVQAEAARDLADADMGGDRSVVGNAALGLAGHEFQGTDEAGGVAGSEQLLWVGGCAAGTAEFFGRGELDVEDVVGWNARPSRPPVEVAIGGVFAPSTGMLYPPFAVNMHSPEYHGNTHGRGLSHGGNPTRGLYALFL